MDDPNDVVYAVEGQIATITLNRPSRKNAFTFAMIDSWAEALRDAARSDIRAVIVTGSGGSFCSGVDLDELTAVEPVPIARKRMLTERVHRVARAVQDLDKPLIAAITGPAYGAGMDMALMCDIRLAGHSARFSESYIRVGLVPGDGGCYFLPRLVGMAKALELLWTGDVIDADEALRIGLVNRVFADDQLLVEAQSFARRLAALPPVAIGMIKRTAYQSLSLDLNTSLDLISSHMAVVQSMEDSAEALAAFHAKRTPTYNGK